MNRNPIHEPQDLRAARDYTDQVDTARKEYVDAVFRPVDYGMTTITVGDVAYTIPVAGLGLVANVETLADTSNDDIDLGKVNIITGNKVQAAIADIGTATAQRRTVIINAGTGTALVTVTDQGNTTINGQKKRLSMPAGSWVVLNETANDVFVIEAGHGVDLVAFAA